jgi:hypothetical protein
MIFVKTVYPCVKCKKDISPDERFCKYCGAKQPELEGRVLYNVFYSRSDVFNMMYGGLIFDIEDIKELASDVVSPHYNYFVGSYKSSTDSLVGDDLTVLSWIPIINGQLGQDQGPRTIKITNLE